MEEPMLRRTFIKTLSTGTCITVCGGLGTVSNLFAQEAGQIKVWSAAKGTFIMTSKINKTEQEWKEHLTAEQFDVTRGHGTERAFTGEYDKLYEAGVYQCVCCEQDLFDSDHKFDSKTGWPSYYQPIAIENIGISKDRKWMMVRNEVHCSRCKSHLGHVFEDGPKPTGLRYCINSVSLKFVKT
jgi:peptide-methionine (R)-S-oxide reductase